jgi:hypothetical protein
LYTQETYLFGLLKKEIVRVMQAKYPGINPEISGWKGQEIVDFQEELLEKVNARISEKWFYTHMKGDRNKLPRIDILNLLSQYAGFANWDDFRYRNTQKVPALPARKTGNRYFLLVPFLTLAILLCLYGLYLLMSHREYHFCFLDADTREPITVGPLEVTLLLPGESPESYLSDSTGCFKLKTSAGSVRMVISSPYYQSDTVTRVLKKFDREETLFLHANENALMLHYFGSGNTQDWNKRRSQLEGMFDDNAVIYQVFSGRNNSGLLLYNKQEFIDKLTMPSASLQAIDVLDTRYKGDKILLLRFRIKTDGHE